jgi:hypothetical protein
MLKNICNYINLFEDWSNINDRNQEFEIYVRNSIINISIPLSTSAIPEKLPTSNKQYRFMEAIAVLVLISLWT